MMTIKHLMVRRLDGRSCFQNAHQVAYMLVNIVVKLFRRFQRHLQEFPPHLRLLYKLRLLLRISKNDSILQLKIPGISRFFSLLKNLRTIFNLSLKLWVLDRLQCFMTPPYWKFLGVLFQVPNATLIHVIHVSPIFHSV